jgi:hypothetical protein
MQSFTVFAVSAGNDLFGMPAFAVKWGTPVESKGLIL